MPDAEVPLRERILFRRRSLSPKEIATLSQSVCERLLSLVSDVIPEWKGLRVALYRSLSDELNLSALEEKLSAERALLHYPRIISNGSGREMEMVEVEAHPEKASADLWAKGPYGIQEPPLHLKAVDPSSLDVILVPGVVFGQSGERIGRGAGYYDRYLAKAPQALRVACAFDFQLQPQVEQKSWDQPVHWIVTESRELRTAGARAWASRRGAS